MEKNNSRRRFKCESCEVECSTRFSLAEHERKHTGEKPFSCSECHSSFKRMDGLKNHIRLIHNTNELRQYSCNECSKKSPKLGNIIRHILQVHRAVKRFICSLCALKYSQSQDLKHHLSSVHNVEIANINHSEKKSIEQIYVLPPVDPKTHSHEIIEKVDDVVEEERRKLIGLESIISSLKSETTESCVNSSNQVETAEESIEDRLHESSENLIKESDVEPESVPCREIWISFLIEKPINITSFNLGDVALTGYVVNSDFLLSQKTTSQMDNPENNIRNVPNEIEALTEEILTDRNGNSHYEFTCNVCKKGFVTNKQLQRHMSTHSDTKPYKCETCNKSFLEHYNLLVHQRTHTGERPYVCPICSKEIRYHKDYAEHKRSHEEKAAFTCRYCDKRYSRKRDLERHLHSHRPQSRFICEICGKGFNRKYLKDQHMLKHESRLKQVEKTIFECNVCQKKFKTVNGLLQHKVKHTGMIEEHQCHICGKTSKTSLDLETHLRHHIPRVKSVSCSECQRMFTSDGTLKIHMDRFHK